MGRSNARRFLVASALLTVLAIVTASVFAGPARTNAGTTIDSTSGHPATVSRSATASGIPIGLTEPFDYAAIPAGTPIVLNLSAGGFTSIRIALDGGPSQPLPSPYIVDTSAWSAGTHILRVEALSGSNAVGANAFVFFIDPGAAWPPDTMAVDVVLIGFDVSPSQLAPLLLPSFLAPTQLTPDPASQHTFSLKFNYRVSAANATYAQAFLDAMRAQARFRTDVQARINLTALIDQRDAGTRHDIFDPLNGWEIPAAAAESYLKQNPPVTPPTTAGFTYYLMNLTALDNPANGTGHWFVQSTPDPDTGVDENWWRLEWDNALNTPMGYPLNAFGGADHRVFLDPTAYEWYLDWAYIWWQGGNGRAPFGLRYQEVWSGGRADYLAGLLNDLNAGLAAELPIAPPQEPTIEVRTFVLSGSTSRTLDEIRWVYNETKLGRYLQEFLPFKTIEMNTTFGSIDDYPALKATVDRNTTYTSGWGHIDGPNVWTYLVGNRSLYMADRPGVFEVLTMNLLYDNRSMLYLGREFTGIGGAGVTTIIMNTSRLYYPDGTREKGLTSTVSHETGHNLGYGHQFGPNFRADSIDGNMGYFRNELSYGTFWEDALYRVYLREKLLEIIRTLESRWTVDLWPEFTRFYSQYRDLSFLGAYSELQLIERELNDAVQPTADAGGDRSAAAGEPVVLDAIGSTDDLRIVNYTWDFGDGTSVTTTDTAVTKTWTREGVFTVTLAVADVAGNRGTAQLHMTVGPDLAILLWIILGVSTAAIAATIVLLLRYRGRKPRVPPT